MILPQFLVPLGWLAVVGPILPFAILTMAVVNVVTRLLAHRQHVRQAREGDAVERYTPHDVTTIGLVLLCFLFAVHRPVGGALLSTIAITVFLADFFEFEARNVEARNDLSIERPKGAMAASAILLLFAAYYGLFFIVDPIADALIA